MKKKIIYILWCLLFLGLLALVFLFTAIAKGWIGYMPPVEELENPNYKFATQVLSADGKVLGTWSLSKENRVYVGYDDLSPNLVNALIATEDIRFAEHSGIDAKALFRAIVKRGLLMQKNAGGGSTITQQLSKQLYSPSAEKGPWMMEKRGSSIVFATAIACGSRSIASKRPSSPSCERIRRE